MIHISDIGKYNNDNDIDPTISIKSNVALISQMARSIDEMLQQNTLTPDKLRDCAESLALLAALMFVDAQTLENEDKKAPEKEEPILNHGFYPED